ncbi:hypothetical protein [Methanobacterium congolense]|uniref:Uncharacterized protein n=1 Tax=Methanobacterium congolense TaxID=118062 RepID=A0A1D3L186_9EURY|nr:hypothetical protein [Methanobacterium congolense]SCG85432.1 putative protein [Methanobacterium congolense]
MKLNVLENPSSIKISDNNFFRLLKDSSVKFGRISVIYEFFDGFGVRNFHEDVNVYRLKEKNIWFSHTQKDKRSLYAFGLNEPKLNDSNLPLCVLDFSMEGLEKNTIATFAEDEDNNPFVLIRVNYPELRGRPFNGVLIEKERIKVLEGNKKRYFISLGQLDSSNFLENIEEFLEEMDRITPTDLDDNLGSENTDKKENNGSYCVLCGKILPELEKTQYPELNLFLNENPDVCQDCLEELYAGRALKDIMELISIKLFNEKSLLKRVDNPDLFKSYLYVLKKQVIVKEFTRDVYIFNNEKDVDELVNKYAKFAAKNLDTDVNSDSDLSNDLDVDVSSNSNISEDLSSEDVSEDINKNIPSNDVNSNEDTSLGIKYSDENLSLNKDDSDKLDVDVSSDADETASNHVDKKVCALCGLELPSEDFCKSDSSPDNLATKCKKCSRKSYAVTALEEIMEYTEPDTPFNKEDLLKQCDNRMKFLDYIWTLQEFDLISQDEKQDSYTLNPEEELNSFIEKYGDKKPEIITSEIAEPSKQKQTKKIIKECEICGKKLPVSQFYASTTSEDGYNSKCKECSKKSHAITALEEIKAYIEPDTPFDKDDLQNQFEDRMKFLDYLWTLQEFDLIIHDEKLDVYALNSEDKLNSFIEKYGDKTEEEQEETVEPEALKPEVPLPQVKNPYEKKLLDDGFKECELCGKRLPLSNFYKSSTTEDGYVGKCKECSEKTNAMKALNEIQDYVEVGKPFDKSELLKQIDNPVKVNYYIWTLQEQNLLEYNPKTGTYTLEINDQFKEYQDLVNEISDDRSDSEKPEEVSEKDSSTVPNENDPLTVVDVPDEDLTLEEETSKEEDSILSPVKKEIIYVSDVNGSPINILMKGIIENEKIMSTLNELGPVISSNVKKLLINCYMENYSEIMIDLEVKDGSVEELLSFLEGENWSNVNYNK